MILHMIYTNGKWVWLGEYYTDPYKVENGIMTGGIIDIKC